MSVSHVPFHLAVQFISNFLQTNLGSVSPPPTPLPTQREPRWEVRCGTVMRNERREREREIPTWATSMLESQLRGRTAVRSLEPSKVEMIPFWSTLRIMVASTKYMSPFLSTAIPEWGKQHKCVSWQGTGLLGWWWWWGCPTTHYLLGWGTWLDSTLKSHLRWHPFSRALCWDLANSWGVGYFTTQVKKEPWAANEPRLRMNEWGDHFASALF